MQRDKVRIVNQVSERTHLLVEDGLGLTTVTALLAVVATLPLREDGVLALLVLRHLMGPAHRQRQPPQ